MVLEAPLSPRVHRASMRPALKETLRQLPPRRPVQSQDARPEADVRWTILSTDRYEVRRGDEVRGYIDVVGAVFVVLLGHRYARATEVLQTLDFDEALAALR